MAMSKVNGHEHEIVVRQYGLRPPVDWGDDCEAELYRMTRLWNRLVEIENGHRAEYLAVTADDPTVAANEAALALAQQRRNAIYEQRAKLRKNARAKIATPELDAELAAVAAEIRPLIELVRAARRNAREQRRPQLATLEERRKAMVKLARQGSGLYWGNYNAVLQSFEVARARALKEGAELRFRHHDGSGRLTAQIIGGLSVEELFSGKNSQLAIAPLPADAFTDPSRRARKFKRRTTVTMVAFTTDRVARTISCPLLMHRPLPDGARCQQAVITRRLRTMQSQGGRTIPCWEWMLSLLLRVPAKEHRVGTGACGIDVGWRRLNMGVRVATVVSDHRPSPSYVVLPETIVSDLRRVDELQGERDGRVNQSVAALRMLDWASAPAVLREAAQPVRSLPRITATMLQRLQRVWLDVAANWEPDALETLAAVNRANLRDWRSMRGLTQHAVRRRKEMYLRAAKLLVLEHRRIGIEDLDWRRVQLREHAGATNPVPPPSRWYRRAAAVGEFLAAVTLQARKHGAEVHRHAGVSTWLCHECGADIAPPPDRGELMQQCPSCSAVWDQDHNAACNLLAAAQASAVVTPETPEALARHEDADVSAEKQPRWVRMQAARDAKRASRASARE